MANVDSPRGLTAKQAQRLINLAVRLSGDEFEPEAAFQQILELATELTASDLGSIHLLDDTGTALRLAAIKGVPEGPLVGSAYPLEHSLSGLAVRSGKRIIVGDVRAEAEYVEFFGGITSELVVPLIVGERVIGVLNLESREADHFTNEQASIVEPVASLLAAVLRFAEKHSAASTAATQSADYENADLVFVLMPFREPFTKYYQAIFKPAVREAGMRALRADEIFGPTEIMRDLWGSLRASHTVLAELTGRNPNVMYEVGLAHGIGKPVVLVAQSMEDVPFDLRGLRCILYDTTDPEWAEQLRSSIRRALQAGNAHGPYDSGQC